MALFPAYSGEIQNEYDSSEEENKDGPSWLNNSTYKVPEETPNLKSSSSSDSEHNSREHFRSKRKRKKKHKEHVADKTSNLFYEDATALENSNLNIAIPQIQLTKPSSSYHGRQQNDKKKKRKKRRTDKNRYFYKKINEEKEQSLSALNEQPMNIEEFLKKTEMFNKCLRNDPHDIKLWLDYIKLQDSGIGSGRGRSEKKLSIIDKALEENPGSDELFHQKMLITESIFPIDKVGMEAKNVITKFPKNLTGWLWVLNSSQYNLSKMTAPGVLLTYEQVLSGVHKAYLDSDHFLDFLLLCGMFLRQCGLWEQLWVLLELYLELNLTTAGSGFFKIELQHPEKEIQEVEDSIITSGLPLGALWLRVERLREGVYFLPVEESPDPQRIVFREDMTPLLFPITQPYTSKLVMNTLLLLKVPPLPLTDSFFRFTGLHKIPWFLDSVEIILAAKYSKGETAYLDIVPELLHGPQYLEDKLGQTEFFNFVNSVFEKCISNCKHDKVYFLLWQMRWWQWIYSFQKLSEKQSSKKKYFLGMAKKQLKNHRDCVPLYTEYALFEEAAGDFDASIKVLETTIHLRDPPLLSGNLYKKDLCNLYRVYIEVLIRKDINSYREKIVSTLVALAFGERLKNIILRDDLIMKCIEKFKHVTSEVIRDIEDSSINMSDVIIPDFSVSWIVCHAWFLYLTRGVWESVAVLESAIDELQKQTEQTEINKIHVILEGLFEGLLEIFNYYCIHNPGNYNKLFELSGKALKIFPNNAFFLNTVYSCELSGIKWSKFSSEIFASGSILASSLLYFMTHSRFLKDDSLKINATSRLQALLEKLKSNFDRCPLFWRLLLQANSLRDSEEIKNTFYRSVEKCPWVKILYYEAAKILPGDLPEIQDLLVEKELRLHITPEELEILREGT